MKQILPFVALLCCLAGCHHPAPEATSEADYLYAKAIAAGFAFADLEKPEATSQGNAPGEPAGVSKTPPSQVSVTPPAKPIEPTPLKIPTPIQPTPIPQAKPRFECRMPPQGTGRKLVLFSAPWCAPCRPTHEAFDAFTQGRGLAPEEFGEVNIDQQPDNKYGVGSIPTIVLIDSQGNELARITGRCTFEQIEDLWLSSKRPHNLNGLPMDRTAFSVSPEIESIIQRLPQLVKSAAFKLALTQQISIPLPGVGEIVIPQTVSLQAGTVPNGFKVAVESGTPAPWVKSKWMGSLYPIPITSVSVVGKKATVELRGWQDLVIALE